MALVQGFPSAGDPVQFKAEEGKDCVNNFAGEKWRLELSMSSSYRELAIFRSELRRRTAELQNCYAGSQILLQRDEVVTQTNY